MQPIATDGVAWSVSRSVFHDHEPYKNRWTDWDAICVMLWTQVSPRNHGLDGDPDPPCERAILTGRGSPLQSTGTFCRELSTNSWIDPDASWDVDSGGSKEACIRWRCTVAQPGEYDWTIYVWQQCGHCVKLLWPLVSLLYLAAVDWSHQY